MFNINSFSIAGLYGHFSISVPFENNRLVLVGENGTGKSTFVLLLYYLLSKQWDKLENLQFSQLSIELNEKTFSFKKEEIFEYNNNRRRRYHNFPNELVSIIDRAFSELNIAPAKAFNNINYYNKIQEYSNIRFPFSIYNNIIQMLDNNNSNINKKFFQFKEYEQFMSDHVEYNLIFLPTYRRIEKDIETIFANYENIFNERPQRTINRINIEKSELVAFGMQDISKIINSKMNTLNNSFRSSLQNIISEYLIDVIGNKYNDIDISKLDYDKLQNIDIILDKIGGEILPDNEKNVIKAKIENVKEKREVEIEDKIIIDFILKILSLQSTQIELESDVELFVNITNKYLVNKEFLFDRSAYQLLITNKLTDDKIELNNLSSGEKQVVSIFAHLFLREKNKYLLLFDEPELSLSVPWQKTFLEDISQSKNCFGVIAVTHSPFIYDNSMEEYCRSINEHLSVS